MAVDANGFVWSVHGNWNEVGEREPGQVTKIDGFTGEVIQTVEVGFTPVGITADADGFVWTVNYRGGGPNFVNHPCPPGRSGNGTVTKLRSSDTSIVGTYPTCGNFPYTYSDMAGYNLRRSRSVPAPGASSTTRAAPTWSGATSTGTARSSRTPRSESASAPPRPRPVLSKRSSWRSRTTRTCR